MKQKNWYLIENKDQVAIINIYDEIGIYGISFKDFMIELNNIKQGKNIEVHINSPGGSVFDGFAIYDALNRKRETNYIESFVDGLAASMAGVIMLAADKIFVSEHSSFMMHNVSSIVIGSTEDMRKQADLMEKLENNIIDIFSERMKLTTEEIKVLLNNETWYHGAEIIDNGLADGLLYIAPVKNQFNIDDYEYLKHLKQEVKMADDHTSILDKIREMFTGLKDDLKRSQMEDRFHDKTTEIENKLNAINISNEEITALKTEKEELINRVAEMQTQIDDFTTKENDFQTKIDELTNKLSATPGAEKPENDPTLIDEADPVEKPFDVLANKIKKRLENYKENNTLKGKE